MGARAGQREGFGGWRDALWLAGRDIRGAWVSFPAEAVVALVPGLYLVFLYPNASGGAMGGFGNFLLDFWFLLVVAVLNVNFLFNRDYYYRFREDNFTKRLSFLRGLPIGARTIVSGRAVVMAVALACGSPSFFLAPYLASTELRGMIGGVDYLWFVGTWIGYALFMMGVLLFMWIGLSWEAERIAVPLLPCAYVLAAIISNLTLDDGLVLTLIEAAKTQGPLVAGASVAFGALGLIFWSRAAEKRLQKRELG